VIAGCRASEPRWRAASLLVVVAWIGNIRAETPAAVPQRIASLNLCTDSMLLEIASVAAIVSVTHVARDPAMCPLHARARRVAHVNHGLVEEIVPLAPDLVLTGPTTPAATGALLMRLGYRVEHVGTIASLGDYRAALLRIGRLLARTPEATALLARLEARISALRGGARRPDSALLVGANGYVPGPDALADDLLAVAGLRDQARLIGLAAGGFLSLEALVLARPEWLLLGTDGGARPALAGEFLRHPVLHKAGVARLGVVELPESHWNCGGEFFGDALAQLLAATARSAASRAP
jgi:iron complex transport system substrate-binding protein